MTLPRLLPRKRRRDNRVRCPAHLKWIRCHACCAFLTSWGCAGPIEAAHVRSETNGGVALKPGDDNVISLCRFHHGEQHRVGEPEFERKYNIDMKALAREFAEKSPPLRRYHAKMKREAA